jgi:hypothetical protein
VTRAVAALAVCGSLLSASAARAQATLPPDPPPGGKGRIGPISMEPKFELTEVGVDGNVFNRSDNVVSDYVIGVKPTMVARMRMGPARFSYTSVTHGVYYFKYKSERSMNNSGEWRVELRSSRVVPFISTTGNSNKDRVNAEIDARADRKQRIHTAGVFVSLFSRTGAAFSVRRFKTEFAEGQFEDGQDLAVRLNSVSETLNGSFRMALTDFTLFSLTAMRETTKFDLSPDRNSTSTRVGPQFDFDPKGNIAGTAMFGYRRFETEDPDIPPFTGFVSAMGVSVTLSETKVNMKYNRDVQYSFQEGQPYYLGTNMSVTVTQRIAGTVDAQASFGRDVLAYRSRLSLVGAEIPADEKARSLAIGLGYRLRSNARVGLTFESASREGSRTNRAYDRRRVFGSMTYGYQQ